MSITFEQKNHVIDLLKKKYPDWDGFSHKAFRRDEVNFKRSTIKKAGSLLSESMLAQLLVTRDTNAFIERLSRIGQATPLLQRNGTRNGDLEILHVPTLDKPVFCAQVYHLLHGTESVNDRLEAYFRYIEAHELPNTWTFPTYLLQFCYPDSEIFVEPQPTEWFLKYIGLAPKLGRPSAETYLAIKEFARHLKIALAEFRPRDMIDIQSAIHVCSVISEPALYPPNDNFIAEEDYSEEGNNQYGYDEFDAADEENFWAESQPAGFDSTLPGAEADSQFLDFTEDETLPELPGLDEKYLYLADHFKSFIDTYMSSPAGVAKAAAYAKARELAEQNFAYLTADHELGEVVTDRVYLHLLPHEDSEENEANGAWIHPAQSAEDVIDRLEDKYGNESSVREQVAHVLLEFIRHCVYKSNALGKSNEALERIDAISLIDVSSITPILQALKPKQYVLLNGNSIAILHHFSGVAIDTRLQHFPALNEAGLQLVGYLRKKMLFSRFPSVQPTDLLDIFCSWFTEQEKIENLELKSAGSPKTAVNEEERNVDGSGDSIPEHDPISGEEVPVANPVVVTPSDPVDVFLEQDIGVPEERLDRWHSALMRKGQLIFHGPAGVGKTYIASYFTRRVVSHGDGFFKVIQFHPSYSYKDFIGDAVAKSGFFRAFCAEASQKTGPCVLLIDEINRANIAEVFGELLYQLEYRSPEFLLANYNAFLIPQNVYIVGTMCDRQDSFLRQDSVVRRRFALVPLELDYEILKHYLDQTSYHIDGLARTLIQLNERIEEPSMRIGISYFLHPDLNRHIEEIWRYEIEPCIEVAFSHDPEHIDAFRWAKLKRRLTR